jgi:hypothetical protein
MKPTVSALPAVGGVSTYIEPGAFSVVEPNTVLMRSLTIIEPM